MKRLYQSLCASCYFSAGDKCDATHDIDGVYLQSTEDVKTCMFYTPDSYLQNSKLIIMLLNDLEHENKDTRSYILKNIRKLVSAEYK